MLKESIVIIPRKRAYQFSDLPTDNRTIKATVKDVLDGVAMVVPWDTGHEEIYRVNDLVVIS